MNGETVKYYYDESKESGFITIPVLITRSLNWNHNDDIGLINLNMDGIDGFFIWKREEK